MNTNTGVPVSAERRDSNCVGSYGAGEDTLRLIAELPAPEELPERIKTALRAAPAAGRILRWRGSLRPMGSWLHGTAVRGAAAAAIVCVVAGGGWRIYSLVEPAPAANVIPMTSPAAPTGGGFSNSGARRVPQTLEGPVLTHPVAPTPEVNAVEKAPAQTVPGQHVSKKKKPGSRAGAVSTQ